jgi:chromosome segregation ATPase
MRRQHEREKLEEYYQKLQSKSKELASVYRSNCAERIESLTNQYLSQRNELTEKWKEREAYRQEIENKNASLSYLLKRGKDAKQAAKAKEDAEEAERLKLEAKNAKTAGKKK